MPVAALITDARGGVVWINRRFSELTGCSETEIVGRPSWFPEGDAGATAGPARLRSVVETGETWRGEVSWHCGHERDGGNACRLEETITPIRDLQGSVTHALWTLHNVSGEVRSVAELEEAQEIFATAQRAARFGVFRWDVGTGRCQWSDQTYQVYGVPSSTRPSIEVWLETVHADDREKMMEAVQETLTSFGRRLQVRYRSADGVRWVALNGQVFRDADGHPEYLIGINMEVTDQVQLETALQVSEARLGLVIDAVSDGIWDWNTETNKVYFSPVWKRILGHAEADIGDNFSEWDDRLHPEDRERVHETLNAHLEGLTPQYISEFRLRCKDGSWKWILARGRVTSRTAEGKPARAVGTHTDISQQKQLQAALREREEKTQSLFESMNEGVAYCRMIYRDGTPCDWIYDEVNPAFGQLTGLHSVEGKLVSELLPRIRETNPELIETYGRIAWTGVPEQFEQFVEPLGIWFGVYAYSPRKEHFVAVIEDITARKTSELAIRKSHDLLSNLARLVPGVIYQYRLWPDGRSAFPYSSPGMYEIYGVTPEEVREDATPVFGRLHPEDVARVSEAILESARTLNTFYSEFRVVLPEQGLRWRWSQAVPERMADGGTLWHGIILDVTERHKAEDEKARLTSQLIQAQKMESVGRLAGGVAHDFNNLLTVILGYSGFLMAKLKPNDPLHLYAREIGQAGNRAAGLTKQLLAFSRKQVIEPKLLNLNATIRESVPMLERLIGEDIEFRMHLKADLGFTIADPDQIYQVIMNLAVNARDAMPNGGTLDISTANVELSQEEAHALDQEAMAGSYLAIAVADTGTGMDEETLRHIFEPFFTTKEEGKGTGLGLATVFGIVRQSNGWIEVRSTPEAGTRFRIFLPRIDGGPPEEPKTADEVPKTGHETILIVEDQEGVRAFTKAVLLRQGYEVLEAAGGEEALLVAGAYSGRIHLLLTDVVLPGMNGKMVSDRLVALYPGIRVIFCSGYTADLIHQRGVAQHGTSFLQKPFRPENLIAKVREVLDSATHLPN